MPYQLLIWSHPLSTYSERLPISAGIVHCITALIYSQRSTCFANNERNRCTFSDDITESPTTKEKKCRILRIRALDNALDMMPRRLLMTRVMTYPNFKR